MYKDGVSRMRQFHSKPGKPIAPYGLWIIGQDRDMYAERFQLKKGAFSGFLTDVNIWNRVLGKNEIMTLASQCGSGMKGNYKAYADFIPGGGIQKERPSCCH